MSVPAWQANAPSWRRQFKFRRFLYGQMSAYQRGSEEYDAIKTVREKNVLCEEICNGCCAAFEATDEYKSIPAGPVIEWFKEWWKRFVTFLKAHWKEILQAILAIVLLFLSPPPADATDDEIRDAIQDVADDDAGGRCTVGPITFLIGVWVIRKIILP